MNLSSLTISSLVVACLFLLMFQGCNGIDKYEEGPFLSFRTAEERVKNDWQWSYYEENGNNLTGLYEDSTLSIEPNNVAKIIGADEGFRSGTWQLISKNTQFQIIIDKQAYAYDILMLKEKEMWLRLEDTVNGFSQDWQLTEKE